METENNVTNLRVASFSCYLGTADNNFLQKIKKALEDPTPDHTVPSREISYPIRPARSKSAIVKPSNNTAEENFAFEVIPGPVHDPAAALDLVTKRVPPGVRNLEKGADAEIEIFGADKYFNTKSDCQTESNRRSAVDQPWKKSSSRPGTPSVYSEVSSSWNSQRALLRNLQRNACQVKQKRALGWRLLTSFACTGPCLNKKAVSVNRGDEENGEVVYVTEHSQQRSSMDDHLETAKRNPLQTEDPHQSLDVFGSNNQAKKVDTITANLERKLSVLTWDAIPKSRNLATTTQYSSTIYDDEMASDASSDLFEIEHISGSGYGMLSTSQVPQAHTFLSGRMSPTTLYAPSEASIEWSAVTASAAEFSDFEERSINIAAGDITRETQISVGKQAPKSCPGGVLGCKSLKTVSVADNVQKIPEKAKHQDYEQSNNYKLLM